MLQLNLINLVKYPWTAAIIAVIWLGSTVLIVLTRQLPVMQVVVTNMIISIIVALVGFRVEK